MNKVLYILSTIGAGMLFQFVAALDAGKVPIPVEYAWMVPIAGAGVAPLALYFAQYIQERECTTVRIKLEKRIEELTELAWDGTMQAKRFAAAAEKAVA